MKKQKIVLGNSKLIKELKFPEQGIDGAEHKKG